MGTTKFDVEKFIGRNDFGLWRLKMKALLVQQGLQDALLREKNLPSTDSCPIGGSSDSCPAGAP